MSQHVQEVAEGRRFEFGKNWSHFLSVLNDERITEAEKSLKMVLGVENLKGKSFLDIGSGSGLFSLAARRLGARVHSFDYDPQSVACTNELKRRYFPDDPDWIVEEGDVLNIDYLKSLGKFDVVYSWGVLHHTGAMWQALENVCIPVAEGGVGFLLPFTITRSIGRLYMYVMKRFYVCAPIVGKWLIAGSFIAFQVLKGLLKDLVLLRNPVQRYRDKKKSRGVSMWHDWIDWVGGYPFVTAKPEDIFNFYKERGFVLEQLRTCGGGHGCNEYVF